jgi:hypothetical protein
VACLLDRAHAVLRELGASLACVVTAHDEPVGLLRLELDASVARIHDEVAMLLEASALEA